MGCSFPVIIIVTIALFAILFFSFAAGPLGKSLLGDIGLPDWLSVPQPEPELPAETVFHIFGFPITNTIVAAWVTIAVLVGLSYAVTRRMKLIPGRLQAAFEFLIGWLYDLCRSVAGNDNGRRFFPIIATIFLFVAFNAWLALLPGYGSITINTPEHEIHLLRPANTDINMPLALALISFVFVEFYGLKRLGTRYLGKFLNFGDFRRGLGKLVRGNPKEGFLGMFALQAFWEYDCR
jgi:F-type H+-transporting ATPase subunit a